jgi:hypothetical protein
VAVGGALVVMDYDMRGLGPFPAEPTLTRAAEIVRGTFDGAGRRSDIGSHLPRMLVDAGIGPPEGTDTSGLLLRVADTIPMVLGVLTGLLPRSEALGISNRAEFEVLKGRLMELSAEPGAYFNWPTMVAVWARRR